jgi:S-adenosyl methyltransferase
MPWLGAMQHGLLHTRAHIERFFDGFELVDPGLVQIQYWRPDGPIPNVPGGIDGGVGRNAEPVGAEWRPVPN